CRAKSRSRERTEASSWRRRCRIARAARLPSLRDVARSTSARQIRVFIHGGAGTPDRAGILRRSRGRVSGEVWLWWLLEPTFGLDPATTARLRAGAFGCADAPWQWGTVLEASIPAWRAVLVCRATLPVTPDWQGMWHRLDSLGAQPRCARLERSAAHRAAAHPRPAGCIPVERVDG